MDASRDLTAKIAHLEMLQRAVERMASNSAAAKNWAVTLSGGLAALAYDRERLSLLALVSVSLVLFWILDSYYLSLEREFRRLYGEAAKVDPKDTDFNMAPTSQQLWTRWMSAARTPLLLVFYGLPSVAAFAASIAFRS